MDTVQIAIRTFLFWMLNDANPVQVLCHSWTPLSDVHRPPRCFEVLSPVHMAGTCSRKTSVACIVGLNYGLMALEVLGGVLDNDPRRRSGERNHASSFPSH